eukprot:CAMPEP_0202344606 /NCGR_PEP_ID=MMETSP1126-20121109/4215_1 /ASSEMBLY_ACC=CAM_ASM_000457 /TAXON_ID=3047 /ORGANISM="Dunaliella tertiolecta, Strain CCMP1320" /LENGTH=317 /DNA_ID=CAMNT_0048935819 /DNA_START=209 /DNA_END=1162 /DNA_ORIENTATION=+
MSVSHEPSFSGRVGSSTAVHMKFFSRRGVSLTPASVSVQRWERSSRFLHLRPCATKQSRAAANESWERLSLLQREMEVAVNEQDFEAAARLRDETKALVPTLSPVQQYLHQKRIELRSGSLFEQLAAIKGMVETGDSIVIPELAACLSNPEVYDIAQTAMWAIWMQHPDPELSDLMMEGCSLMSSSAQGEKAFMCFQKLIDRDPGFAEAYNKRATMLYIMRKYEASVGDCKQALRLEPYHFGAASGMGLCYVMLDRNMEAVEAFETALSINPGLTSISSMLGRLKAKCAAQQREQRGSMSVNEGNSSASGAEEKDQE